MIRCMVVISCLLSTNQMASGEDAATGAMLSWSELPSLPDPLGVAGPFAGVHQDALIVAGGANFPQPVWDNDKVWHDRIHVLIHDAGEYRWLDGGRLPRPIAYGVSVSTDQGVVCMGGNDANQTFADVFLMRFDASSKTVQLTEFPPLPQPRAFAAAALIDDVIYMVGGQSGQSLESVTSNVWSLDLATRHDGELFRWQQLDPMPAPSRAFHLAVAQRDGDAESLYVISGRRQQDDSGSVEFLRDVWQFTPSASEWTRRSSAPRCVMAGTGLGVGQSRLLVLGGADGSLFGQTDQLRDDHPGFPKEALVYQIATDTWTSAGSMPANHVTTVAVRWGDKIVVPSGETRPRVRSPKVWQVFDNGQR